MIKPVKQPISEDVGIYDAEKAYLNQEPNQSLYYIDGNVIVITDSGKYLFGPLEDMAFFVFGGQLETEDMRPVSELKDADRDKFYALNELNRDINSKGIYAVAMEKDGDTVNAIIAHPEHPENTYFRISVPALQKLIPEQIAELPTYNEERTLDNPYQAQLDGDMLIAY